MTPGRTALLRNPLRQPPAGPRPPVTTASRADPLVRLLLLAALALGFAVLSVMTAPRADAHDALVATTPAAGATIGTPPAEITLTLAEPALALGTQVRIEGPSGQVQQGTPRLAGNTVNQALRPGSPAGAYTVTWRVTSQDGHPVSGTFHFTATKAGVTSPTATTPSPASTTGATPSASSSTSSSAAVSAASSSSATATSSAAVSAAPSATARPAGAPDDSDGSALPWVIGVGAAVLVLGAGAAIWSAGRRT